MSDIPWTSIAVLFGFLALLASLSVGLTNLATRTRRNSGDRVQPGKSSANVRHPPPKTIHLGYMPAGPETSFAPARWAFDPDQVRERGRARLIQNRDRIAAMRLRVELFEGVSAPGKAKFDTDRRRLLQQLDESSLTLRIIIDDLNDEADRNKLFGRAYRTNQAAEQAFAAFCKAHGLQSIDAEISPAEPSRSGPEATEIERRFTAIFAMRTAGDRERMVAYIMRNKGCDRLGAMKFAVDDWEKDNRSWR